MDERHTLQEIAPEWTMEEVAVLMVAHQPAQQYSRNSILIVGIGQVFKSYRKRKNTSDKQSCNLNN